MAKSILFPANVTTSLAFSSFASACVFIGNVRFVSSAKHRRREEHLPLRHSRAVGWWGQLAITMDG